MPRGDSKPNRLLYVPPSYLIARNRCSNPIPLTLGIIEGGGGCFEYWHMVRIERVDGVRARKSKQNLKFGFPSGLFLGTNIAGLTKEYCSAL